MTAPIGWIKRITREIPELNVIPLFGKAPPFNWKRLEEALASNLETPNIKLSVKAQSWKEAGEMKNGMGTQALVYPIVISPIGTVFWIMSYEDMVKLTSKLMKKEGKTKVLSSEILQEGFYRYLLLEALSGAQKIEPLTTFSLHLSDEERLPEERTFCMDVEITLQGTTCWGRLAIEAPFRSEWVHHFENSSPDYTPSELSQQLYLDLTIETGSVLLKQKEFASLQKGDFVLLDKGGYDARKHTGIAMAMLGENPIFNVKIKNNHIELIDYAFYYEDNMEHVGELPPEQFENNGPAEGEVSAIKDLPLLVNVEIGKIKITLDELMRLTPGSMLDLPIHPDQSVSLVVGGKKVGRAELLHLGDTLGLRILEIG